MFAISVDIGQKNGEEILHRKGKDTKREIGEVCLRQLYAYLVLLNDHHPEEGSSSCFDFR